jgi:HAE1 family hydrophobic/amphiphilic exporter-1
MSALRTIINKPVSVAVLSVMIMILSLFTLTMLPQELIPEITFPTISVITRYQGAGPEEIETTISEPLERVLVGISGVTKVTSTSRENQSVVSLDFGWDIDLDVATNDIRDQLDRVRNTLPDDADAPVIFRLNLNQMIPIMYLSLSGAGMSADDLKPIAEDDVIPYLEQVDGVASISIAGGRERQVRIEVIQNRLEAYNITLSAVVQAIQAQNIQMGAGNITQSERRVLLRTAGEFDSIEQIANTVITTRNVGGSGQIIPIRLRDIADVTMGYEDRETYAEVNGYEALSLNVRSQSGGNSVEIARNLTRTIEDLNKELPNDIKVIINFDTSRMTTNSINQVVSSATSGLVLIVIILLLFLRNIKAAAIVSITMPLSILITLMFMYFFDLSLNLMSLTGLTLGVGMIVDSSIVIIENIYRYREKGVKAITASYLGASEMAIAITASTLTTVSVFLPLVLFQRELEIIGVLFSDLSFTIIIALVSSLVSAVTIVPVLAGNFLALNTPTQKPLTGVMLFIDKFMARFLTWLDNHYAIGIDWALSNGKKVIFFTIASLVLSFVILSLFVGSELMPEMDSQSLSLEYRLPVASELEQTLAVGQNLTARIMQDAGHGITFTLLRVGEAPRGMSMDTAEGTLTIILPNEFRDRTVTLDELRNYFRSYYDDFPGVSFSFRTGGVGGGGAAVTLNVSGNNQKTLEETVYSLMSILEDVSELSEVSSNLEEGIPEAIITIDRDKASSFGLNVQSIARELNSSIDGATAGVFRVSGDEYDIRAVLREQDRLAVTDLDRIFLISTFHNTSTRVPLSNIASVDASLGPVAIIREDQTRQLEITANTIIRPNGRPIAASEASAMAWDAIYRNYIPVDGIMIREGGDNQDFAELLPTLMMVIAIAIMLVYSIMASQFESLKDPFIIILSLMTLPIGPILIYWITGAPFSAFSIVGMIMLVGIAVNTGIILVDYTNLLRRRGVPLREAVIQCGRLRLRPILMTSLTTTLGLIPMAIAVGDGTAMTKPIGLTVIGGMISSTIMTLFLVPVLYFMFNRKDELRLITKEDALKAEILMRHSKNQQTLEGEAEHE